MDWDRRKMGRGVRHPCDSLVKMVVMAWLEKSRSKPFFDRSNSSMENLVVMKYKKRPRKLTKNVGFKFLFPPKAKKKEMKILHKHDW